MNERTGCFLPIGLHITPFSSVLLRLIIIENTQKRCKASRSMRILNYDLFPCGSVFSKFGYCLFKFVIWTITDVYR